MTSMPHYNHHCTTWLDKGYTTFTWALKDWRLIYHHCKTVVSPPFVLHNTDGKTCTIKFLIGHNDVACIDLQFPTGIQYRTMEARLSLLSEDLSKMNKFVKIFKDSDPRCSKDFRLWLFIADMTRCLQKNTLVLFLELTIVNSGKESVLHTEIQDADVLDRIDITQNFKVILDSKDLCDVTFVVRGEKLYAHKVILAASSDVFRAMFITEMKEMEDDSVEIVDTDATVFRAFLSYMYTEEVSEIENVVDELIVVADKYQVMSLRKLCERYMSKRINDDNVITYLLKAYQLSCNKLHKNCIHFIRANMHVLKNSSDLVKLSEYPSIVSEIFDKTGTN